MMEDLRVPAATSQSPAPPRVNTNDPPLSLASEGSAVDVPLMAALEASLQLAASLLTQCTTDNTHNPIIDLEVGGYHWTVNRCEQVVSGLDHRLSPREVEIVRMVGLGLTNRAIATALDISQWTVATYLRRIFSKLEVSSRAAMVAQAIELGLYPAPEEASDYSHR